MAITLVGFTSDSQGAVAGNLTPGLPAGWQSGDFAIVYARADDVGNNPELEIVGGSTGWTEILDQRPQGGRDRQENIWWKILGSSETDPEIDVDPNQESSVSVHVFRGVDQTTPLDVTFSETTHFLFPTTDPTTACPPVTTVTNNAAVVLFQGIQQNNPITTYGAPAGFTLTVEVQQSNANMCCAYDLDVGAAGTITPGAWTHTVSDTGADSSLSTVALRPAAVGGGNDETWTATAAPADGAAIGLTDGAISLTLVAQNAIGGDGAANNATASTASAATFTPTTAASSGGANGAAVAGSSSAAGTPTAAVGTGSGNDATVATGIAQPTGFVSDDFNDTALIPQWSFVDPRADVTLRTAATGTISARAEFDIPSGGLSHSSFGANRNAPWLAQVVNDVDITLTTKWLTLPAARYQIQGLQFSQNNNNWLRFDVYHDGTDIYVFAASSNGSSGSVKVNTVISPTGPEIWLRVERTGDSWTFDWSDDGAAWNAAVTFTHVFTLTGAGPYAGTDTPEPGFVAQLDYVEDSLNPIAAEDVGPGGPNPTAAPGTGGAYDATVVAETTVTAAAAPAAGGANRAVAAVSPVPAPAAGYGYGRAALDGGRVNDGLLSFWGFDEGSGTVANDLIGGNTLHLEAGGGFNWQTGGIGISSATRFETDGPATGVVDQVRSSGQFSVEGWVRPLLSDDTGPAVILGMNEDAGGPGNFTLGQGDDDGNDPGNVWSLRVRRVGSGNSLGNPGTNTTVGTTLTAGELHHIMFTVETSGSTLTIDRYVNGVLDGTTTRSITAGQAFDNWTDQTITAVNESVNGRAWAGDVYLLALYDRALSDLEVAQNYAAGPGAGFVTATPTAAAASGGAYNATVSTSSTAATAAAPGTGGAYDATASTQSAATAAPSAAAGDGQALFVPGALISLLLISENPIAGIGGARDATTTSANTATAAATAATGDGQAINAAASTESAQTAPASAAAASGTANSATVATASNATAAATAAPASGGALDAAVAATSYTTAQAGNAAASGGANNATVSTVSSGAAAANPAAGTGTANTVAAIGLVLVGLEAPATGGANNPTVSTVAITTATAAAATASGSAYDSTVTTSSTATVGVAAGAGVAYNVVVVGDQVAIGLPDRLQPHQLIVVRPSVGIDDYGNDTLDYGPAANRSSIIGWIQQDTRTETFPDGRNPQEQRWLLLTNTLTIRIADRIEWVGHPSGPVVFTVHGPPEITYRGLDTTPHHLEATLRIQEG